MEGENQHEKLEEVLKGLDKGTKVSVELHQNPDPDALAGGLFMYELLKKFDLAPKITYASQVSPINRIMVTKLLIPGDSYDEANGADFDWYFFVDHSGKTSPRFNDGTIPKDKLLGIVDHHDLLEALPEARYSDRRQVGAVSTIFAEYLKDGMDSHFSKDELERLYTALFLGIITDTHNLRKNASVADVEMHQYLSGRVDMDLVSTIERPKWPKTWMDLYARAIQTRESKDGVTVASVGFIDPQDRDVIAMTADQLHRENNVQTVYVVGIRPDFIDVSIRTSDPSYDFKALEKLFPEGRSGGKESAGGIKIPNQFAEGDFLRCTDYSKRLIEELALTEFKYRIFR